MITVYAFNGRTLFSLFIHHIQQQKVYRNRNGHHHDWCQPLANVQPKEEVEQTYLHEIVHRMTGHKARNIAASGLTLKGEIGG